MCALQYDVNCGGAPRELASPVLGWSCAPTDPSADRGDGCPYAMPAEGSACSADHPCRYAEGCGWNGTDATCAGGAWQLAPFNLPPPP